MIIPELTEDLAYISKMGNNPLADNDLTSDELKKLFDKGVLVIQKYINEVLIPSAESIKGGGAAIRGLLDNAHFRNPVNQRGQESISPNKHVYWLDRWLIYGNEDSATFELDGGRMSFTNEGDATAGIYQRVEASRLEAGKIYTLAAKLNVRSHRGSPEDIALSYSNSASAASEYIVGSKYLTKTGEQIAVVTFVMPESVDGFYNFRLRSKAASIQVDVDWIDLFLGGYIAEDLVGHQPGKPGAELAECQRYYQIRSTGDIVAEDLRPVMRAAPTVSKLADGKYEYSADL